MKKLCFGTLLNLVYQAKGQGVTYITFRREWQSA